MLRNGSETGGRGVIGVMGSLSHSDSSSSSSSSDSDSREVSLSPPSERLGVEEMSARMEEEDEAAEEEEERMRGRRGVEGREEGGE